MYRKKWLLNFGYTHLILPDQPNRAVRTRMLRGVGGEPCEGCPYTIGDLLLNGSPKGKL